MRSDRASAPYVKSSEVYDKIINEGFPFVKVKKESCDMVFAEDKDGVVAVQCIPTGDNLLFWVSGAYVKRAPPVSNLILARTNKEAKQKYKNLHGWEATECWYIPPGEEADEILTNPLLMPL